PLPDRGARLARRTADRRPRFPIPGSWPGTAAGGRGAAAAARGGGGRRRALGRSQERFRAVALPSLRFRRRLEDAGLHAPAALTLPPLLRIAAAVVSASVLA